MRSPLIMLVSLAMASVALSAEAPVPAGAQVVATTPERQDSKIAAFGMQGQQPSNPVGGIDVDQKEQEDNGDEEEESSPLVDVSKKSTRGYDEYGRQEVVNIGPGMSTTADGQTRSRSGPRGRQRGVVLPHKYIVRLKSGVEFSSLDLHSKVAERNRLIHLPPTGESGKQQQDGQSKLEQEIIPNQVDHEYDFGTWKGYSGQFSSEFLKELESLDEVEYVEEDTLMWAWGLDVPQGRRESDEAIQQDEALGPVKNPSFFKQTALSVNGTSDFAADVVPNINPQQSEYFSVQAPSWGLTRISQRQRDLQMDYSYMSSAGGNVDVYIIDSGVFAEHTDFQGRATNLVNFVPGEDDTDMCGHGTHVAGIVAGYKYGVAKSARIQAIKVLDSEGQGSTSQVLAGINYMIRHASNNPNPKKIVNMSLGGQFSPLVEEAVRSAVSTHGIPFFVAAGNTGDDACQYSPAGVREAFAVGGSDKSDKVGWYSCVGSCVRIFAPGSGIASDWIQSPTATHVLDGTSMAAPHVAGVAALFLGAGNRYGSAQELYADLIRHSTRASITGLQSNDKKTSRNLIYNKLEDPTDVNAVKPKSSLKADEERETSMKKAIKKQKDKQKPVHRHH